MTNRKPLRPTPKPSTSNPQNDTSNEASLGQQHTYSADSVPYGPAMYASDMPNAGPDGRGHDTHPEQIRAHPEQIRQQEQPSTSAYDQSESSYAQTAMREYQSNSDARQDSGRGQAYPSSMTEPDPTGQSFQNYHRDQGIPGAVDLQGPASQPVSMDNNTPAPSHPYPPLPRGVHAERPQERPQPDLAGGGRVAAIGTALIGSLFLLVVGVWILEAFFS